MLLVCGRTRAEFQEFCDGLAEAHGYSVVYQGLGQAAEAARAFADTSTSFFGKDLGYSTQVGRPSANVLTSALTCPFIMCLDYHRISTAGFLTLRCALLCRVQLQLLEMLSSYDVDYARLPYLRGSRRERRQERDSTTLSAFSVARSFFQELSRRRLLARLARCTILQGMDPRRMQQFQD